MTEPMRAVRTCVSRHTTILLVLVLCGCEDKPGAIPVTTWHDSAGIAIAMSQPELATACSLAAEPRVVIGTTSGDPMQELFGVFGAGLLSTGEVAVANLGTMEVRIYDSQGEFERAFGREGGGPGEFRRIYGLWVLPGDTLWVGDTRPWRYQVYTADGEWVRTVKPEPEWVSSPRQWGLLQNGRAVLGQHLSYTADRTFPETWLRVVLYDAQGAPLDTLGDFPYGRWGQTVDDPRAPSVYPFFESGTRLAGAGQRVAIGHGAKAYVAVYEVPERMSAEADVLRKPELILKWDAGDRSVTTADVQAEKDRIWAQYEGRSARLQQYGRNLIRDERPAADSFPAYVSLMVGTDGSLWVSEYPAPGDDTRHRLIFNSNGRLRCRMATTGDLQLYEVGQDYVLAKQEDELGVERVVLYDLLGERND